MCLILVAQRVDPAFPLVLAANRDEFFARPTLAAAPWTESNVVVGGRDLEHGGSWLAVSAPRRLAAVTNVRNGARRRTGKRSRGLLVSDFILSDIEPMAFLRELQARTDAYDGFNLLVAAAGDLFHYSNLSGDITSVTPGIHGLSNHLLDTPWPKIERGKAAVARLVGQPRDALTDGLFEALGDRRAPADETLPQTGVSLEWERVLATAFINTDGYGTRASTVVLIDHAGEVTFIERTFSPEGMPTETRRIALTGGR
jgi:uncharacterized protein with NRDE domain